MTSWITICDTCKREGWIPESQPRTDGELFADLIEARAMTAGVKTRRVSCMMGCVRASIKSAKSSPSVWGWLSGVQPSRLQVSQMVIHEVIGVSCK